MRIRNGWQALALALICVNGKAWASDDDDRPKREDPWEYDEAKSKKREKTEHEENGERTFGNEGDFVVSAERLVGVSHTGRETNIGGAKKTSSSNHANVLLNQNGDPLSYSIPRIAFDYFVIEGLSLGASLGFSANSGDADNREFLIAPRVGYVLMFGDVVGIWPRAGVTYQDQKTPAARVGIAAATVEANLVIVPTTHAAITIGPTLDATIGGKLNPVGPEGKTTYKQDEVGLQAGLSLAF